MLSDREHAALKPFSSDATFPDLRAAHLPPIPSEMQNISPASEYLDDFM